VVLPFLCCCYYEIGGIDSDSCLPSPKKNRRRFLEGPNFMPWFQRRRAVAEQEQHRIWRQARSKADVQSFLTSMTEVEVVDSFSAVERHLIIELQVQIIYPMFSVYHLYGSIQMHGLPNDESVFYLS
jgi:hypothetical protein